MENLTWRDACLCAAIFGLIGLGYENELLKKSMHGSEVVYSKFMSMNVNGKPLTEMVNPASLMIVPQGEAAIVCGVVSFKVVAKGPATQPAFEKPAGLPR